MTNLEFQSEIIFLYIMYETTWTSKVKSFFLHYVCKNLEFQSEIIFSYIIYEKFGFPKWNYFFIHYVWKNLEFQSANICSYIMYEKMWIPKWNYFFIHYVRKNVNSQCTCTSTRKEPKAAGSWHGCGMVVLGRCLGAFRTQRPLGGEAVLAAWEGLLGRLVGSHKGSRGSLSHHHLGPSQPRPK